MATGVLRWWNAERGFGFITPDSVYFHISALEETGIDPEGLQVGQRLAFETVTNDGKAQAVGVKLA